MNDFSSLKAPRPLLLWIFVFIGILAISCASLFIRLADAPSLTVATYRVTLASLFVGPYVAYQQYRKKSLWGRKILFLSLFSGFFLALHFAFWIHSLGKTTVASSVTLVSTMPLFVALFSYLWLEERPGWLLWVGIGCTIVGSSFVAGLDLSFSPSAFLGDVLALLGALMGAGYLLVGRWVRQSLDLTTYVFTVYGMAALILLTGCLLSGAPLLGFSERTYLFLLLLGLVPQLVGHTTFNWTLKYLPATMVAILILGEPIGATLLAYLFLGETVSGVKTAGLTVLGLGIVLSSSAIPSGKQGK